MNYDNFTEPTCGLRLPGITETLPEFSFSRVQYILKQLRLCGPVLLVDDSDDPFSTARTWAEKISASV